MDKSLIKKCVDDSTHFNFIELAPNSDRYNLIVETKEEIDGEKRKYWFQVGERPFDSSRITPDPILNIYSYHPITPFDKGSADVLLSTYNFSNMHNPRLRATSLSAGEILSRKPSVGNNTETIGGLLARWGAYLTSERYEAAMEAKVASLDVTFNKPVRIKYSVEGEINGYNHYEGFDHFYIVSYEESNQQPISKNSLLNAIYIDGRIGDYVWDNQPTIIHRISEVTNGKKLLKTIAGLKVAVVGLGGVGSMVVETLYKKGVRDFILYDNDNIDIKNRSRISILSKDAKDGDKKIDMFDTLHDATFTKYGLFDESNQDSIKNANVVIICVDEYEPRQKIGKACIKWCVPYFNLGIGYDKSAQIYSVDIVLHPTNETVNMPTQNVRHNEYIEMDNLQMAEGPLYLSSRVALAITNLCGLYDYPNISNISKGFREGYNVQEESDDED